MSASPFRLLLPLLLLAACSRDSEPRQPADEPEAADHPTGISAKEGYVAKGTTPADAAEAAASPGPDARTPTTFTCDKGASVQTKPDGAAVRLDDGRTIQIAPDPADASHFKGEALEFRASGNEGDLSQDEAPAQHCEAS